MGRTSKTLLFFVIALIVGASGAVYWGNAQFNYSGPLPVKRTLIIPHGAGVNAIARDLERAGVLSNPLLFRIAVKLIGAGKPLQAGEYEFPAKSSMQAVLALLRSGQTVARRVTFAEGLSTVEILSQLTRTEGLNGPLRVAPGEGTLLPETYYYSYGDKRLDIVRRMTAAMQTLLANLWKNRADGLPLKSPIEALILASIVEKETGLAKERPHIAAVFINRLNKGMRLQSDPTVVYGMTGGKHPLGRALLRADLKKPSPFNTYMIKALPPKPISNPGAASLEAVLRPAQSQDLYFVADGTGGHVFAKTLAAHNRNVAKWRKYKRANQ